MSYINWKFTQNRNALVALGAKRVRLTLTLSLGFSFRTVPNVDGIFLLAAVAVEVTRKEAFGKHSCSADG